MLLRFVSALSGLVFLSQAASAQLVTLKSLRPTLVYPDYTDSDKQLLADQAFLLAEQMYVHRDLKMKAFGAAIDPVERLRTIKQLATSMSPEQLNDTISRVFLDQRDLHYNFYRPTKLACWAGWVPVSFANVVVGKTRTVVAAKIDESAKKIIPDLSKIQIGDRLLAYDSMTTEDALKVAGQMGAGANEDALRSRAVEKLSLVSFSSQKIPAKDSVAMIFAHANGQRYAVDIPWLGMARCATTKLSTLTEDELERPLKPSDFDQGIDDYQVLYNQIFHRYDFERNASPMLLGREGLSDTADKTIHKGIVRTSSGTYGFLRLDSFVPSLDTNGALAEITRILTNDFAETDGLIIDLRDNGGGSIGYTDMLTQLFSPLQIQPSKMRILATPLNERIFSESSMGVTTEWADAIRDARVDHKTYAQPLSITPTSLANTMGQFWFKPVALLTNANCYSACDMFAAVMQDHNSGIIVGEDRNTGGGGANVMEQTAFVTLMKNAVPAAGLVALPLGQGMRVSWRESVRTGSHEGELIENAGIASNLVLPRSEEDLYHNEAFLMEKIGAALAAQKTHYLASVGSAPQELLLANGVDAKWTETAVGTDKIEVTKDDVALAHVSVTDQKPASIALPGSASAWDRSRYQLVGFKNGRRVWRVWRDIRWVGTYDALDPEKPLTSDFSTGLPTFFKLENPSTKPSSGWQVRDGLLVVGQGAMYEDNIRTDLYVPISTKGLSQINVAFDLKLKSEEKYDFFRVYTRVPGTGQQVKVLELSGEASGRQTLTIKVTEADKLDLVFEFQSDGGVTDTGVALDNLEIAGKKAL